MSHEFSFEKQKQYFEFAYQTGSDIWSHVQYQDLAQEMLPPLPKNSLVLDIGSGRGLWLIKLLELNYQVLGIDYIASVVDSTNNQIVKRGYTGRGRCVVADVLDIPFTDRSFSLVTDIGTFHHTHTSSWDTYVKEVLRVLKKDGYYLNVSLSCETKQFQGFSPSTAPKKEFCKFGMYHYFFSTDELSNIFGKYFEIIDQRMETFPSPSDPKDEMVLIFTLMKKQLK